jgi:hypothetical protein
VQNDLKELLRRKLAELTVAKHVFYDLQATLSSSTVVSLHVVPNEWVHGPIGDIECGGRIHRHPERTSDLKPCRHSCDAWRASQSCKPPVAVGAM